MCQDLGAETSRGLLHWRQDTSSKSREGILPETNIAQRSAQEENGTMDDAQLAAIGSLPYIDQEYDEPGMKEAIEVMIQQECGRFAPRDYLAYLGPEYEPQWKSELLKNEYERARASNGKPTPFDVSRYEVKEPEGPARASEEAWREHINKAMAQIEHQEVRSINLELLEKYGRAAWLTYCGELERMRDELQNRLLKLQAQKDEVNLLRLTEQTDAGTRLRDLETQLAILVSKDVDLQLACQRLDREVSFLRQEAKDRGLM